MSDVTATPTTSPDGSAEERVFGFATRALHAGQKPDPATGARAVPIYQTTSYVFEDTEHAAELFKLQRFGNIYTRIMNPTTAVFEERMASLERGVGALALASGQAAQFIAISSLMQAGDEIVARQHAVRRHVHAVRRQLPPPGLQHHFVDPDDPENFRRAITPRTKLLYGETIGNPAHQRAGYRGCGQDRARANIPLMIDNTMASPYLCRPIEHGADIVVHSATKFIGGHGTSIGGVIVDSGRFPWNNGALPTTARAQHGLSRHSFSRDVRRLRLHHQGPRRRFARLRPGVEPVQLVPVPSGTRNAQAAHGRHSRNALAVARTSREDIRS